MQVWTTGATCAAYRSDHLTSGYFHIRLQSLCKRIHVGIERSEAVLMLNGDGFSKAAADVELFNRATACGVDSSTGICTIVNAFVFSWQWNTCRAEAIPVS